VKGRLIDGLRAAAAEGVRNLDPAARRDIVRFVSRSQCTDGGFRGRGGTSDVYYTMFALECLMALGEPLPSATRLYLESLQAACNDLAFVDRVAWVCSAAMMGLNAASAVSTGRPLRRVAGASHAGPATGVIYEGFLATLAHEVLVKPCLDNCRVRADLTACLTPSGGFAALPGGTMAVTPVTAAAVLLLAHQGSKVLPATLDWLLSRQHPDGGFTASAEATVPDLLSTGTALHALSAAGRLDAVRGGALLMWLETLQRFDGGFAGSDADSQGDCEYTFYALLTLGHLVGERHV
jgi:prenyltransferase beta subunit